MTMPAISAGTAPDGLMRLDRDGALAVLTFQQPQTLNAITAAFARELGSIWRSSRPTAACVPC